VLVKTSVTTEESSAAPLFPHLFGYMCSQAISIQYSFHQYLEKRFLPFTGTRAGSG
jgi:hypothetical protein